MLDDDTIERYARQIVVPGIGAAGQETLLHSTVLVVGHLRGCRTAGLYLRAAGVHVESGISVVDAVVVCDASVLDEAGREEICSLHVPVFWYATDRDGFTSGVHPGACLPAAAAAPALEAPDDRDSVHDAAACEAASAACATLLGLPCPAGPFRFDC